MTSPNRPPLSKRMLLVAATAGTLVLGSAGVAFANTHDSTGVGVQHSVESSTSVGETTTSVENPTAPALETKTFATRGGTVVVQIDHANHRVTLVSATPADGWTVKSHNTNPHGHGFVDVRLRMVTATDPGATSTTDNSGRHGNGDKAFTGTEIRVRVGFIAWRQVEFVTTRTFGPVERPVSETSTTTDGSLEATSTTVEDNQGDNSGNDGKAKADKSKADKAKAKADKSKNDKSKNDKSTTDSTHQRGNSNNDPAIHDQADDHGGRGHGGNNGGGGGNRESGDGNGGNRGGNG